MGIKIREHFDWWIQTSSFQTFNSIIFQSKEGVILFIMIGDLHQTINHCLIPQMKKNFFGFTFSLGAI